MVPLIETGPFSFSVACTATRAGWVEAVPKAPISPSMLTRWALKFGLMKLSV